MGGSLRKLFLRPITPPELLPTKIAQNSTETEAEKWKLYIFSVFIKTHLDFSLRKLPKIMKIMAENYPGTHVFSQVEEFYRGSGGTKRSFRLSFIRAFCFESSLQCLEALQ